MLSRQFRRWLRWQPQPVELLARIRPVKPWLVQMDVFSKGIDNTRTDVHLSPTLVGKMHALVRDLVQGIPLTEYRRDSVLRSDKQAMESFRQAYRELSEATLKRRHRASAEDEVRLFQIAMVKFLLRLVSDELHNLREELNAARDKAQIEAPAQAMIFHDRVVVLAREGHSIAYQVNHLLFQEVERLESGHLRKLRKSLIGNAWPVPREALFNPLLQFSNILAETEVMRHYPLLFVERQGREHLDAVNRLLVETLKDYLPTWTQPQSRPAGGSENPEDRAFRVVERVDQSGFLGFLDTEIILSRLLNHEEYHRGLHSWLDDPGNLQRLLDPQRPYAGNDSSQQAEAWLEFQRALRRGLAQALEGMGLMPRILASYWTPRVCREIDHSLPERTVYQYLCGGRHKRSLLRRLGNDRQVDAALVAKTLDFAASEIQALDAHAKEWYGARLLVDFLALRRDLKLAYKTYEAMDAIHLVEAEQDLVLSRANNLLYEFLLANEHSGRHRIRNHVILKADVRGSTGITSELRARELNPATHFSRNFFDPISKLLPDFGAEKVFVEGDAVILVIYEYSDHLRRALSVARCCGLGAAMLDVVHRQNVHNQRHGLPRLELGIGIAYHDGEPTFLYDEGHKITISPAINLADRLASCSAVLREGPFASERHPFHIEVLKPSLDVPQPICAKTDLLRYNVNGIELSRAAFDKLRTEIVLHPLELRIDGRVEHFHLGRYPDLNGRIHWLIVRESSVHGFDGRALRAPPDPEQRFYEVVTDEDLIGSIKSRLKAGRQGREGRT